MSDAAANAAQIENWNLRTGEIWVRFQPRLDAQISPLGEQAMTALAPAAGERVLDIGCGCGQTSVNLATRVAPGGAVLGVDVSEPMLGLARSRPRPAGAAPLDFRRADAQVEDLGAGAFDAVFSRFGVMFFADPSAAFANIRAALRPGGRLSFVCWRAMALNPMMTAPLEAARALLPPLPPADPLAPGPFAFADAARVRRILGAAGFTDIVISPFDADLVGGTLEEAVELSLFVGPLATVLRDNPQLREPVTNAVRETWRARLKDGVVVIPAAVWIVTATNA